MEALARGLLELRTLVEATLDFPEEEIDFLEKADARGRLGRLAAELDRLLDRTRQGALLREGMTVVLAGQPNVGKSSLLNALAGAELAIVTPIAGTTRDRIGQTIQIEGVPVHVVDTAGLRPTSEGVRVRLRGGKISTIDGPFTETKEVIGGYAILEAGSKEEAVELTRRFLKVHGDEWDIECEVRQLD